MAERNSIIDVAIECLLAGACERDSEEWHHCRRVEKLCTSTAREMDWEPEEVADLKLAALLHHMDRSRIPESAIAPKVAGYLHEFSERQNGSGPPTKSREAEGAGIIALVDAFDRLTSSQHYRRPFSVADAVNLLAHDSQTPFDESAVEALRRTQSKVSGIPQARAA